MEKKQTTSTDRPEAYPKPSETDTQLNHQSEFIDQEPNTNQKEISDVPADSSATRGGDAANGTIGNP